MMKQEKLIKVLLQIWQGLLDHSFSLLHQVEHSLNDTDLQKYNKESMKGCVFQALELSEIHYVVFSD